MEPLRQGVGAIFGSYEAGVAAGLRARHDHGSQYVSDYFQDELKFLEIESSPAFVREPEGNGVAERFIRTVKGAAALGADVRDGRRLAARTLRVQGALQPGMAV